MTEDINKNNELGHLPLHTADPNQQRLVDAYNHLIQVLLTCQRGLTDAGVVYPNLAERLLESQKNILTQHQNKDLNLLLCEELMGWFIHKAPASFFKQSQAAIVPLLMQNIDFVRKTDQLTRLLSQFTPA